MGRCLRRDEVENQACFRNWGAQLIVRQLETDNLLVKETPQRGKVGQPLVPFSLNPDGAFSIGLKIGRRSGDLILLDLTGKVRCKVHQPYVFPTPQKIMDFVAVELEGLLSGLSLAEIAASRAIAIDTARHRLKTIFAKTGTNRQVELVRLMSAFG